METGLIYKATSPSGKSYIGQTINFLKRKTAHKKAALITRTKFPFYNAIRFYGWDSIRWTIVEDSIAKDSLNLKEIYYIKLYKSFEEGYNATRGGGSYLAHLWTEEERIDAKEKAKANHWSRSKNKEAICKKMSEALQGRSSWNKGISCSIETKQKLSFAHKGKALGRKHSQITLDKMSGMNNWTFGKPFSEITRKKISKSLSGDKSPAAKLTWQIVENIRDKYRSGSYTQVKLSKEFNTSRSNIRNILANQRWKI